MKLKDLLTEDISSSTLIDDKDRVVLMDFSAVWIKGSNSIKTTNKTKPITLQNFVDYIEGTFPERLRSVAPHQKAMKVTSKIFKDHGFDEISNKFLSCSLPVISKTKNHNNSKK